jgi:glycosyltransferase involved in cell wall biosynthesis
MRSIRSINEHPLVNRVLVILDRPQNEHCLKELSNVSKVVLLKSSKPGVYAALNEGIRNCEAPFIARQDDDDLSLSNRFFDEIEILRNSDLDVVFTSAASLENGKRVNLFDGLLLPQNLLFTCAPIHPTLICKSDFFKNNSYPSILPEDYGLWMQTVVDYKFFISSNITYLYSRNINSVSLKWNNDVIATELFPYWNDLAMKVDFPNKYCNLKIWKIMFSGNESKADEAIKNWFVQSIMELDIPFVQKIKNIDFLNKIFI